MRVYLIFVIGIGIFGSMLSTGGTSVKSGNGRDVERIKRDHSSFSASYQDVEAEPGTVQLDRSQDGHFYADVEINGATVHALVDTGASAIALTRENARSAGIATSIGMPNVVGQGADGDVFGEQVTLDKVALGHKSVEGMQAIVLNSGQQTLLGQSFLSQFESVEIRGDRMILR